MKFDFLTIEGNIGSGKTSLSQKKLHPILTEN